MRRPVLSLVLAAGLLLALAAPVLALDTGTSGPATLPDRFESKQGFLLLNEEFPGRRPTRRDRGRRGGRYACDRGALARLEQELAGRAIFGESAVETNEAGTVARVTVPIAGDANGTRDRGRPRAARRRRPAGVRGDGRAGVRGRRHGRGARLPRHGRLLAPARAPFVLGLSFRLAHDRLPLARRPGDGRRPEPALGGSGLRAPRARLQEGVGNELLGLARPRRSTPGCRSSLRSPLRALDGLPGLPAQPHPRALQPDRRHGRRRRLRRRLDRGSSPAPRSSSSPSSGASPWATRSPSSRWASASPSRS